MVNAPGSLPVRSLWSDTHNDQKSSQPRNERGDRTFSLATKKTDSRLPLDTSIAVDVCIIGAGYTGLWTAWYLINADPQLRIAVVEAEHVGFGASGRNGGWVQTALPMSLPELAAKTSRADAMAMHRAMVGSVEKIGAFARQYAPDACFTHAGNLTVARTPHQRQRLNDWIKAHHELGWSADDATWFTRQETHERLCVTHALGSVFTPHCAVVQPFALVTALADAVAGKGVRIYEHTRVTSYEPRNVHIDNHKIECAHIIRATEGYTALLPGQKRNLVPIYSLMIATAPMSATQWKALGWDTRFTFSDARHNIIYGQRTADDRIAFGGRGAPYHFGSSIKPKFDGDDAVHNGLQKTLIELFPSLAEIEVTHRWGGPIAAARDWYASVVFDVGTGIATAGGYVGDGVGSSHLAGQTLADLVIGADTERTRLPWVNHRSRKWEPEPVRSFGINAGLRLVVQLDAVEQHGTEAPIRSWLLDHLL